jgi:methylated-DNA-[protein]-cysteine S-methyltransferase
MEHGMNQQTIFNDYLASKFGLLHIQADPDGLMSVKFCQEKIVPIKANRHTNETCKQLIEYFAGKRSEFDLTLNAKGTTFQQQVWQQLLMIPTGKTCTYADIARNINNPKAVRAVGSANGRNPIAIIVPCHRVIGSNGSLTGYAWGVEIKAQLLSLEQTIRLNSSAH